MLASIFDVCFRLLILAISLALFQSVVLIETKGFNVFEVLQDSPQVSSSIVVDQENQKWVCFLGGEFTFSVLLPLGFHLLMTSTQGGKSISAFVALFILAGMTLAHGVASRFEFTIEDKNMIIDNVSFLSKIIVVLTCYMIFCGMNDGTNPFFSSNIPRLTPQTSSATAVRILVKTVGFLNTLTAVFVIYLGLSVRSPAELLPNLKWEGFGYRYDIEETFGSQLKDSFGFFYLIMNTMVATIFQTLVIGLLILLSPFGSKAPNQAMVMGVAGVPMIILANALTMGMYSMEGFDQGQHCMMAHILLLVQTNIHVPIVWWIYETWYHGLTSPPNIGANGQEKEKMS